MRLGKVGTYAGLKRKLAENVRNAAQKNDLPVRALLGCISTSEEQLSISHVLGRSLNISIPQSLQETTSTLSVKDIAKCVLTNDGVMKVLFQDIPTEKLVVDFSSPNIAKPFHVGHLNSTFLGNYIAQLKTFLGDEVVRINYLGDWGTQFGIVCAAFKQFGSDDRLKKDPLNHLVDVYVQGNKLSLENEDFKKEALDTFAKLEADEKEIKEFWWNVRDVCLKEYFKVYAKLGIKFDLIQGESAYHKEAFQLIKKLGEQKLLVNRDGVQGLVTAEDRFVSLVKSNGSTLYLTRDICAAVSRKKKLDAKSIYYVVDNSQQQHFRDLRECLKILLVNDLNIVHVNFGRIHGLSTRKGQVVLLQELVNETAKRALEKMRNTESTRIAEDEIEKVAFDLGLSALYVNTLDRHRQRNSHFSWEQCFSLKGNSGISLQYVHARICTLIEHNKDLQPRMHEEVLDLFLENPHVRKSLVLLAQFDECLMRSDFSLQPHVLLLHLFKLQTNINKVIKTARVKGEETKLAETRLLLLDKVRETLAESFRLLGFRALRKM